MTSNTTSRRPTSIRTTRNEHIQYDYMAKFTKVANMLPWFETDVAKWHLPPSPEGYNRLREHYSKEREISLYVLWRHENGKCFCKIKCPINPLPVKGEFEAPSIPAVKRFLFEQGWEEREVLNFHFFAERR